jgi:hypothetical protein
MDERKKALWEVLDEFEPLVEFADHYTQEHDPGVGAELDQMQARMAEAARQSRDPIAFLLGVAEATKFLNGAVASLPEEAGPLAYAAINAARNGLGALLWKVAETVAPKVR